MKQIIPFAHDYLKSSVQQGEIVVDATLGNGHDSLLLSEIVGENGRVIAFDIQEEAIETSKALFKSHGKTNIHCFLKGHEQAEKALTELNVKEIGGAIFNLGYLPNSNHEITTEGKTTIAAFEQLFKRLKRKRYIVFVVYPGHAEGKREKNELLSYFKQFPSSTADIITYQLVNRSDKAPFVVAVYKK